MFFHSTYLIYVEEKNFSKTECITQTTLIPYSISPFEPNPYMSTVEQDTFSNGRLYAIHDIMYTETIKRDVRKTETFCLTILKGTIRVCRFLNLVQPKQQLLRPNPPQLFLPFQTSREALSEMNFVSPCQVD